MNVKFAENKVKQKRMNLIVKNGIYYELSLLDAKHRLKKTKISKKKKWFVPIHLYSKRVYDQKIIDDIIENKKSEEMNYVKIKSQEIDRSYNLVLSITQYEYLKTWYNDNADVVRFSMIRVGADFDTRYIFKKIK